MLRKKGGIWAMADEKQTVFFGVCVPAQGNPYGSDVVKTDLGDFIVLSVSKTKDIARQYASDGLRIASVARHEDETTFISWAD
jgi:hypothetical protein